MTCSKTFMDPLTISVLVWRLRIVDISSYKITEVCRADDRLVGIFRAVLGKIFPRNTNILLF